MKINRNMQNRKFSSSNYSNNGIYKSNNNFYRHNQKQNFHNPKFGNIPLTNYNDSNNYINQKFLGNKRNINYSNEEYNPKRQNYNNRNNNEEIKHDRYYYDIFEDPKYIQNRTNSFNSKNFSFKKELPIEPFKKEILNKIDQNRITIISGSTGCGKSTQVPQYIYYSNPNYKILMTQPRRIAAVSIAKRLSEEMHQKLGKKIGFHVSMNPNFSSDTKILVETTGIFLEELIHKNLEYSHIIIDEVHERDIYIDLVLAMIKWYFEQHPRSKMRIILMSATISEDEFANYLKDTNGGKIPIIKIDESPHLTYEFILNEIYLNIKTDLIISEQLKEEIVLGSSIFSSMMIDNPCFIKELFPVCAALIEKICKENDENRNGILIFVPGLGEIHELLDYLQIYFENNKDNLEFLILHSQIADTDQDKIFKMNNKRKIILATNIAESSITISNVDFVIDFCLVKQTRYDPNQNSSLDIIFN